MDDLSNHMNDSDLEAAEGLIKNHLFFALLLPADIKELVQLMTRNDVKSGTVVVKEDDVLDSIYLIASGRAKVIREHKTLARTTTITVGTLTTGQSIGLSSDTFFSITGFRTANVIAETDMVLYRIDFKALYRFLTVGRGLYPALLESGDKILVINVLKTLIEPSGFSHKRIQVIFRRGQRITFPPETVIAVEHEHIINYYIILRGEVEVTANNQLVTILKPGDLLDGDNFEKGKLYAVTAKTRTECRVFRFTKKSLQMKKSISFYKKCLDRLKNWFRS